MLKITGTNLTSLVLFCLANTSFADTGSLFTVNENCHIDTPYPVVICLDGKGPVSCQNYLAHATHLTIKTTIPNQAYPSVGIKVLSPLFTPTDCTPIDNGYCLFPASDTTSTTIIMSGDITGFLGIC